MELSISRKRGLIKTAALLTALIFLSSNVSAQIIFNPGLPGPEKMFLISDQFSIPKDLGSVESFHFAGKDAPFIAFIQNNQVFPPH